MKSGAGELQAGVVKEPSLLRATRPLMLCSCIGPLLNGCDVRPAAEVGYSKEASALTSLCRNRSGRLLGCASIQLNQIRQS